jgi:hypothetical protein
VSWGEADSVGFIQVGAIGTVMDGVLVEYGGLVAVTDWVIDWVELELAGVGYTQLTRKAKHSKLTDRMRLIVNHARFTWESLMHSPGSCIQVEYNTRD